MEGVGIRRGQRKMTKMFQPILDVRNLYKYFPVYAKGILRNNVIGYVHAVDDVSFIILSSETIGLVGESGSGKTTAARTIINLTPPNFGEVLLEGLDIYGCYQSKDPKVCLSTRRAIQYVFQDPYASLNPRLTVRDILREPFEIHGHVPKEIWDREVYNLLKLVGLEDYHALRYPHEFSGGQRQRICIARALAINPRIIFADEPVSSLDVSIRAQVLNLLKDLQGKLGLSYLYISHDMASVKYMSNRILVMYLGRIVEAAENREFFSNYLHPYTQALISAIPIPDPERKMSRIILPGEIPSPINPPKGCRFHPRCRYVMDKCKVDDPALYYIGKNHFVACFLYHDKLREPTKFDLQGKAK